MATESRLLIVDGEELKKIISESLMPMFNDFKESIIRAVGETSKAPKTLTFDEAAKVLHLSRQSINTLMRNGKLRYTKLSGSRNGRVLFDENEIKRFLEER